MEKLKLVAGGSRASDTMTPGLYEVRCVDANAHQRGRSWQVKLIFVVDEAAWNDGTELKQWYNLNPRSKTVSQYTKYARAWELAAGRSIQAGEELDPAIFVGKTFTAYIGYSSQGLDNVCADANTETKKNDRDFLRIHRLEKLLADTRAGHMVPYDPTNTDTNTSINTGVGGGGGGERSIYTNTKKDTSN